MIDLINEVLCPNCGESLEVRKEDRLCYPKHKRKFKFNLTLTPIWYLCRRCGANYIPVILQRVELLEIEKLESKGK